VETVLAVIRLGVLRLQLVKMYRVLIGTQAAAQEEFIKADQLLPAQLLEMAAAVKEMLIALVLMELLTQAAAAAVELLAGLQQVQAGLEL
jgi:hypothetical protein